MRLILATFVIAVLLLLSACGVSPTAYLERRDIIAPRGASEAVLMAELEHRAEEYIKASLKNPYSAKFHQNKCRRLPAGTQFGLRQIGQDERMYQVITRVEATNSFGAFLVENYTTTARYNHELHVWEIIKLP